MYGLAIKSSGFGPATSATTTITTRFVLLKTKESLYTAATLRVMHSSGNSIASPFMNPLRLIKENRENNRLPGSEETINLDLHYKHTKK